MLWTIFVVLLILWLLDSVCISAEPCFTYLCFLRLANPVISRLSGLRIASFKGQGSTSPAPGATRNETSGAFTLVFGCLPTGTH